MYRWPILKPVVNPPPYPSEGDFGTLLEWHLNSWGTRPTGNTKKNGAPWHLLDFAAAVHPASNRPKKNLENWMKPGEAPPQQREWAKKILEELFGNKTCFKKWRQDLIDEWEEWYKKPLFGAGTSPQRENHSRRVSRRSALANAPIANFPFSHRQRHKYKAEPSNLIQLLRTDLRATTLVGRADELAMLGVWLAAPQDVAVKCVIGGAGAGKTRLAIELCQVAEAADWFATFIPSSELQALRTAQLGESLALSRPTLIVIDYAATSAAALKGWLSELAQSQGGFGNKLRILLLERHADRDNGWWADLCRPDSNDHASASDLIGPEIPHILSQLDAARDRRALLAEVMAKAAPLFDPPLPAVTLPAIGADPLFDAGLADNKLDNGPLYLSMAAICAVESAAPTALAMNRLDLARRMATLEEERLTKFANARGFNDGGKLLKHIIACITLQNGCELAELPSIVTVERNALDMNAPFDDEAVAQIVCDFLPIIGKVEPIRPDLIGEHFCLSAIEESRFRKDEVKHEIVLRCWQRDAIGTVETLIRCGGDFAQGSTDHAAVRHLNMIIAANDNVDQLPLIVDAIPKQTLAFRDLVANAQSVICERLRALAQTEPDVFAPELAKSLNNLAYRLADLGRREEALTAIEEAVAIGRPLAIARPDAFAPGLATSLINLSDRLSELGQREKALSAIEEVLTLYRPLALARPDAFAPDLALSLNNLAIRLSGLGQREEALAAVEEAVARYRPLAVAEPDVFAPNLAASLNNLAISLSALRRREEAFAAVEEAVTLYRPLAVSLPDAFVPDLAMSLHTLANRLGALGRREEALAAIEEAVTLYRPLAEARPDAFEPDLAGSLTNLAIQFGNLGRHEEALAAIEEAVVLYRPLAVAQPDAFAPELAGSLHNLTNRLVALGLRKEALAAIEEAVAIGRPLAVDRPDAFAPDLAESLSVLSNQLEANFRLAEAVLHGRAAIEILLPHFLSASNIFEIEMRDYLDNYIRCSEMAEMEIDNDLVEQVVARLSDQS